jgi:two-component system sensor histidine kinase YesM
MEEIETNNERIRMDFSHVLTDIINVSDWIYQDTNLSSLVTTEYLDTFEVYQAYSRYHMFEDYLRHFDEIEHIRFFVENSTLTDTNGIYVATNEIIQEEWYQAAVEGRGRISWIELTDHVTGQKSLNLVRAVYQEYQLVGVLTIALDEQAVKNVLADSASTVFITLNEQTPLFSYPHYPDIIQAYQVYQPIIESVEGVEGNYDTLDSEQYGEEFTLNISNVEIPKSLDSRMQVVGVVPTSTILSDVNRDLQVAYLILIGVFSTSIFLLILFIRKFNDRIVKLKEAMTMVSGGDFDIAHSINGNDELSEVYDHMYITMKSIERLMEENYEHAVQEKNWQLQLKELQFKMLASQINPHFLYNTLEMIRMKALRNKDEEVAQIVKILSKLMRKSLERNQKELSLNEELEFIEMYLQIQQLRFGDQIEYTITQQTTQDYTLIPLLIQPIIENSFIHGVEPKIGKGIINLSVKEEQTDLIIQVEDNGVGMSKEKQESLNKILLEEVNTTHLGINNVHQRIRYFYGEKYGLKILSEEGKGTTVTIKIPAINSN